MLFPDASFERVRRNFSDTLYRLQKTLGNDWLIVEGETVALRLDTQLWVDVWDALTSDRPYRKAWTKERALEYVREQTGQHFDSQVVEAFLIGDWEQKDENLRSVSETSAGNWLKRARSAWLRKRRGI